MSSKKYLIKKRFCYAAEEGGNVYVQRWKMEGSKFIVDPETQQKIPNIQELKGEALKVGKKCKAIEELD